MDCAIEISLFGTCVVRFAGEDPKELRGAKHRALIAMLATAPMGRRTRTYLQNALWGSSDYDAGHQNLRRALSDMRKAMGPCFDALVVTTNNEIELELDRVKFIGTPDQGVFLEDLAISVPGYQDWVRSVRRDPSSVEALYRLSDGRTVARMRPSIVVLPMTADKTDTDLGVLADWVAGEACRSLSHSNLLTVISHLSSRQVVASTVDIAKLRDRLDLDYIVTVNVRRESCGLVVDFDFIDALRGEILWNRHLSCPELSFRDELNGHLSDVMRSIGRSIAKSAVAHVRGVRMPDVADHQLVMAGVSLMHRAAMRDFLQSRDYLSEATRRVGDSAETHAWLGKWYVLSVFKGLSTNPETDTKRALDCTARALDTDPESSFALTIDGFAHNNLLKRMDVAEHRYDAALDVNPNESLSWLLRGALMAFQDNGKAAVKSAETARRLSPVDPFGYYYDSLTSTAYLVAGDFQKALDYAERSLMTNDRHISTLRTKTSALYFLGRTDEARAAATDIKARFPSFSLEAYRKSHPSAGNKAGQMVIEALQASGIT